MAGRGTITELSTGRFRVFVSVGMDDTGKAARHTKVIHGTRKDAEKYLVAVLRERDLGRFHQVEAPTLNAHLDRWLEVHRSSVRQRTTLDYTGIAAIYLRPELGATRLNRLTAMQIQSLYADMTGRGLSPRTVRKVHAVLAGAIKQAVRWKLLHENPCADVRMPRIERRERPALDTDGARRLLAALKGSPYGAVLTFALVTGMRPSEYQALRPEDVDLRTGIVQVRRSIEWLDHGAWRFADNKTASAQRQMDVPAEVIAMLGAEHRARLDEMRARTRGLWQEHGLLFPGPAGTPIGRQVLGRHLRNALRAAGLPDNLTPYSLRHSCATVLLEANTSAKKVAERLGHASIVLTMNTYSHVTPTMQREVSDTLGAVLFPPDPPPE